MTFLYKLLRQEPGSREGAVIATSALGIAVNLLLAAVKIIIGSLTASIAVISEGVNNATDSASSLIAIVGTKLAGKRPTKKHPFGYGRIEYLTSLIIAVMILMTGIELLKSSVELIINPEPISPSYLTLGIVALSAVAKLFLGSYTVRVGKKVDSGTLIAVGQDGINDCVVSVVTIVSMLAFLIFDLTIDAWAGAITALFVLKAGIEILRDTLGKILGEPADKELADKLYREIRAVPEILGAADMMLHNYGPDEYSGSVNIEIDHSKTLGEIYGVIHALQLRIMHEYGVVLVFGMYAVGSNDEHAEELRRRIASFVKAREHVLSYHAIFLDHIEKKLYCDLTVDYELPDRKPLAAEFKAMAAQLYPEYSVELVIETEYV